MKLNKKLILINNFKKEKANILTLTNKIEELQNYNSDIEKDKYYLNDKLLISKTINRLCYFYIFINFLLSYRNLFFNMFYLHHFF